MAINFDWIQTLHQGRQLQDAKAVVMRKHRGGKCKDGQQGYQMVIIIPEEAMKASRMVVGDRVLIGFAKNAEDGTLLAIKRVVVGGYTISTANGAKHAADVGKSTRARVAFAPRDGVPEAFCSSTGGWRVEPDGLLIAWDGQK